MTAWEVEADGYRLVTEDGAILGLAYDEWPWPWGDPRYEDVKDSGGVSLMPGSELGQWKADGRPLRLVRTPGTAAAPLPAGAPYAFMGMSDQLAWVKCDCPWWHRLPFVGRRVHADLP